jgi:hypothetical protein
LKDKTLLLSAGTMRIQTVIMLIFLAICVPGKQVLADPPSLPEGLQQEKNLGPEVTQGPALPSGMGDGPEAPGLPSGLGSEDADEAQPDAKKKAQHRGRLPLDIGGFWELRGGVRIHDDPVQDDVSLGEARLQLSYDKSLGQYIPRGWLSITNDFIYDAVADDHDVDLEKGEGWIDLREFWLSFTPVDFIDVKGGRQIMTWGTGNLIFLNDLFPKDYRSFFLGRDVSYLKAPSDALKVSLYSQTANLDIVYTPLFDADRFIDGSRVSFFDPSLGGLRGENMPVKTDRPDACFEDDEIAARIYRNLDTYEVAAYAYHGFWKGPSGADPVTGRGTFPPLSVLGASVRGPTGPGIGNAEFAWYVSEDDKDGDNPFVNNGELRFLVGYEQEIARDLTMGLQYYLERMLDYDAYRAALPSAFPARDENRQWVTVDLTKELMAQNQLVISLFTFYSLSSGDVYLRPRITYDFTDAWKFQAGGNIFSGDQETFFGRFEENSNVYAAIRYSY